MYLVRKSNSCVLSKLYGGGEDWKKGKLPEVWKKGLWHFCTAFCPDSSLLPAEHCSAVPIALLVRQWALCYLLPLKTSNIIFPNHMEEVGKQINKRKAWVKEILFLSLVSEWLCNTCCWSVGFLDGRCSRHHVFLANLAQVIAQISVYVVFL